jgi:hypothetical protein
MYTGCLGTGDGGAEQPIEQGAKGNCVFGCRPVCSTVCEPVCVCALVSVLCISVAPQRTAWFIQNSDLHDNPNSSP